MTILTKRLSHLQALGLPSDAEMIRRARAFAIRSGLTLAEFAGIAGLNASSLRVFLAGHYDKNCQNDSNTWLSAPRSSSSSINTKSGILCRVRKPTTIRLNSKPCAVRCGLRFATAALF